MSLVSCSCKKGNFTYWIRNLSSFYSDRERLSFKRWEFSYCQYRPIGWRYGKQNAQHIKRDLFWKDQGYC